jgi:hypothetical protein
MKAIICLLLISLLICSCIDEVNIPHEQIEPKLVVDGWVSNDWEMSYIKIYHSAIFQSGSPHLQLGHSKVYRVYIETLNGKEETDFVYMGQHSYEKEIKFQPRPDWVFDESDRYRVNIIMEDGDHIQSDWQEVMPKLTIQSFGHDIVEKTVFISPLNGNPFPQKQHFLKYNVNVEVQDPRKGHHYFLKTNGIEELLTVGKGDFCTCECYNEKSNVLGKLNVQNEHPNSVSGAVLKNEIAEIPLVRLTRFYLKLNAYSLTENAAAYLNKISIQQTSTGSIFDPMPFKISGNLKNLSNPKKEVLGNFFTANHTMKEEMVKRGEYHSLYRHLNMRRESAPVVEGNCQEFYTNATTDKPLPFRRPW